MIEANLTHREPGGPWEDAAAQLRGPFDLVLVNRKLDATTAMDCVDRRLKQDPQLSLCP